jgi:hypothetical protein
MTVITRAAVLLLSSFFVAMSLPAQSTPPATSSEVLRTSAEGEVVSMAINAALGGLSAGALQLLRPPEPAGETCESPGCGLQRTPHYAAASNRTAAFTWSSGRS